MTNFKGCRPVNQTVTPESCSSFLTQMNKVFHRLDNRLKKIYVKGTVGRANDPNIIILIQSGSGKPCNFWTIGPRTFIYGLIFRARYPKDPKLSRFVKFLNHCHGDWKNSLISQGKEVSTLNLTDMVFRLISTCLQKMSKIYCAVLEIGPSRFQLITGLLHCCNSWVTLTSMTWRHKGTCPWCYPRE